MDKPVVSVIVLTYNSSKIIRNCLRALLNQNFKHPYEVVVVDDGSTDGTCEIAREMGARLIKLKRHIGSPACFGLLRNIGVTKAKAEIIAFTDDDCIARKNWLDELYRGMEGESCVVGPVRNVATSILALADENWKKRMRTYLDKARYVKFLSGGNSAIRRSVLTKIGGFSSLFVEDTELGIRLTKRGYKIKFVHNAVVYHLKSVTIRKFFKDRFHTGIGNSFMQRVIFRRGRRVLLIIMMHTVATITTSFFKTIYFINRKKDALETFLDAIGNLGYLLGLLCGYLKQTLRVAEFTNYERKIKSLSSTNRLTS